uniref:Helicase C-terminal domain-containing protein n=1 Tax=Meloidogyne hapla TaxID=6305 RepID=A0A1I8BAM3_MELHA
MDAFKVDDDENDKVIAAELESSFAHMSLDESGLVGTSENAGQNKEIEKVFLREYASTKVVAVLERLKPIIENGDKCVIVSQWTSMLAIIEYHLKHSNTRYTSITGLVKTEDRQHRVNDFNRRNGGPSVMLLSLTAGGVGLNLVGGNHLFMVDLHWNPALELQACDRIHRLGQTKNVFIHKAASKKLTKLTKDELMFLFELDKPAATLQKTRTATALASTNAQATSSHLHPK